VGEVRRSAKHKVSLKDLERDGSAFPSEPIVEECEWFSIQKEVASCHSLLQVRPKRFAA
jgi:hypothetical protein